jgi:hypothetical protein
VTTDNTKLDSLSSAVSLTVLELDHYRHQLIPAYLLANLMSPSLWSWRSQKNAYSKEGVLLSPRNRLNQLQRFLHRYTFTSLLDKPGADPWGLLDFAEEEKRLGPDFVRSARVEYDETLGRLATENPESQFGQIINQPYYKEGLFPRLKNETIEVMDAFSRVDPDGQGSGKCAALGMLWAAALIIWGQFSPDKVFIMGNQAHMFVFLDEEDGHLLNNGKWFSSTRINNRSELSEVARLVSSSAKSTFFYNPSLGICNCTVARSEIPHGSVNRILSTVGSFLSNSLKHPHPDEVEYVGSDSAIPNPLEFDSAVEYQAAIVSLARELPGSIYEYALYAFRLLDGTDHEVYMRAAMRDYNTRKLAENITTLSDALAIVDNIKGTKSIFNDRDRIAMPDEVLYFNTGAQRDRALLLFTLLRQSTIGEAAMTLSFGVDNSSVLFNEKCIDMNGLERSA